MFAKPKLKPEQLRNFNTYKKHVLDEPEYGVDNSTSAGRFKERVSDWLNKDPYGYQKHYGWWFLHNCISHPFVGLIPCKSSVEFHDWTSEKLNQHAPYWVKPKIPVKSPMPVITKRLKWIEHHVVSHIAIGLVPCIKTFHYHDVTAMECSVKGWEA